MDRHIGQSGCGGAGRGRGWWEAAAPPRWSGERYEPWRTSSAESSSSLNPAGKCVFSTERPAHWKAAALFNRRIDCALESACLGPSAQGGGLFEMQSREGVCVFCLRMGCYHIQTPGGH